MGIYDRDYLRASWDEPRSPFQAWGAVHWLIAANVSGFILQLLFRHLAEGLLLLSPGAVLGGELWRLLSSLFCHAGIWHLLFNMLMLWWLGTELETLYGSARFLRFYLLSGLFASLFYVGVAVLRQDPKPALGASGAVMGVTVLYAFHYPRRKMLLYGIVPIEIRWLAGLYILMDLSGVLSPASGIANACHLGGAAYGAAYALWERRR